MWYSLMDISKNILLVSRTHMEYIIYNKSYCNMEKVPRITVQIIIELIAFVGLTDRDFVGGRGTNRKKKKITSDNLTIE